MNQKSHEPPTRIKNTDKVLSDKSSIANEFNNYFGSIGQKIANKIPKGTKAYQCFLCPEVQHRFGT